MVAVIEESEWRSRTLSGEAGEAMAAPVAPSKPWRALYNMSSEFVACRTCASPIAQNSDCLVNLVPAFTTLLSKDFDCHTDVISHSPSHC